MKKATIDKVFNKIRKNKVSPVMPDGKPVETWEDWVKVENNTSKLANFEQEFRQELAREIINAGANKNTENKSNDKSIAPLVLGIGGVVILVSLIGVVILRQKRIKNKSRK